MTHIDPNHQRIRELYERYINATATKDELTEFFSLAADPANEPFFENLTDSSWDELTEIDNELQRLKEAPVYRLRPSYGFKWSAAAAILLLGFSTYFYFSKKAIKPEPSIAFNSNNDIAPGANKAILTLSNGTKILLDSSSNGILAQQGNTKVIKTGAGVIAYQELKEKTLSVYYDTLSTPRGGQFQLVLPDGTRVWLNAASSIIYPTAFIGKERKVKITGEAYFEVIHDASKPFIVKVNESNVEDLGTHFNINAYPEEESINTTLLEGSVKILPGPNHFFKQAILKPGQQSRVTGNNIQVVSDEDLDQVMAWKNGEMALTLGNTQKLMQDISRWYDVNIEYAGKIPEGKFSASINRNVPLSSILNALKANGIQTKLEGKKLIIL